MWHIVVADRKSCYLQYSVDPATLGLPAQGFLALISVISNGNDRLNKYIRTQQIDSQIFILFDLTGGELTLEDAYLIGILAKRLELPRTLHEQILHNLWGGDERGQPLDPNETLH